MSDTRSEPVPDGWIMSPLDDLGAWHGGGTPAKDNHRFWENGTIPWVSPKDMKSFEIHDTEDHITEQALAHAATQMISRDAVLIVTRSGILRRTLPVAVSRRKVALNQDIKALVLHSGFDPRFVAYALKASERAILHGCVKDGTTVQSIETPALKRFAIPVAPAREQCRIADALDELFSDVDAGVALLKAARTKLKAYRASVLKSAVDGSLTAEWREEHLYVEPAANLLIRILGERRTRWEREQLAAFAAKAQHPPNGWRSKYVDPAAPATDGGWSLPDTWCLATVDQLAAEIQYGTSAKTGGDATGIPVLRMGNITPDGRILTDELKYLPSIHPEFPELLLDAGDLLFNRTNSAELVGKTAVYRGIPERSSFASYLIRVQLLGGVAPPIVAQALNSTFGRAWIKLVANQTVGQANVNGSKLAAFVVPLPPRDEQDAIVEIVEDQLSVIDHLEADLDAKLTAAQSLRQSILRHAFTGQLVPQDPNDEPASVLLARITAEREAREAEARPAKTPRPRGRRTPAASAGG